MRLAYAPATARAKVAPHAGASQVLSGRWVFSRDLGPVGVQFFCDQLCKARQCALAHFRACNADDDAVVRVDDNPGVDFRWNRALCDSAACQGNMKRHHQTGGGSGS